MNQTLKASWTGELLGPNDAILILDRLRKVLLRNLKGLRCLDDYQLT